MMLMRKDWNRLVLSAGVAVALLAVPRSGARAADEVPKVDFTKQVRPICAESCYKCHGPDKKKGDLRLDSPESITKGGSEGKAVEKGAPEDSPLYLRIVLPTGHDDIMPSEGKPLTREQADLIGQWIMQGADFGGWKGDAVAGAGGGPAPLPQVAAADPVAVEKLRQAGARDPTEVQSDVEAVRLHLLAEDGHAAAQDPLQLEQLVDGELLEVTDVPGRDDHHVSGVVRVPVEDDVAEVGAGEHALRRSMHRSAGDDHLAARGSIDARDQVQESRFAAARFAGHGNQFAGTDVEVDVLERAKRAGRGVVRFADATELDHGVERKRGPVNPG